MLTVQVTTNDWPKKEIKVILGAYDVYTEGHVLTDA